MAIITKTNSTTDLQTEKEMIQAVYRKFEEAFAESNIDAMVAPMYERTIFAWGSMELIGKKAVREAFKVNMADVWKDTQVVHNLNGIEFLSSDVAIAWGNAVVTMPNGTTQTSHIMNTLIKREGKWLFAAEQICPEGE